MVVRRKWVNLMVGVSVLSVLALAGCGSGASAPPQSGFGYGGPTGANGGGPGRGGFGNGGMQLSALGKVLNLPSATVMSDLKNGESLAQIAQQQGVSQQALMTAMKASYKTRLDQAVSNGRLPSSQEQQMISRYAANLPNLIERKGLPSFGGGRPNNFTNGTNGTTPSNLASNS